MNERIQIAVVVVTHNHRRTVQPTLASVAHQTSPADAVAIVDCGSEDTEWMDDWSTMPGFHCVRLGTNAGFTGGCNEGWRVLNRNSGYVLFLNPDVILPEGLFSRLRRLLVESRAESLGALSPRLLGYDFEMGRASGGLDSTGVFPSRFGGWKDRRDGSLGPSDEIEIVPALCGAFFLARVDALRDVALGHGRIWDDRYFAYKEDIELSLRLRRSGWKVGVWHGGEAYHGRGWKARELMSRAARLMSARNELRLHATYMPWRLPFSLMKLSAVSLLDQ
ncbi:MAG: hypothetical protein DRP71_17915 [Verrucomicrobia bacterium]|nr:MAG: hypothetical protein DRP71_17915 [Verrucomicrobiota bacterium]